jgi:hypothetical protein
LDVSRVEVLELGLADLRLRDRYDALFERCAAASIQQSAWWAESIHEIGPDRPILLLANLAGDDVAGIPLYLFEGQPGRLLASVPQAGGLGGVFTVDGLSPAGKEAAYAALLRAAAWIARREHCLAFTVNSNPFGRDEEHYARFLEPDYWLETFVQWLPLPESLDGGFPRMANSNERNNLRRKLRKAGDVRLRTRWTTSLADLEAWYPLHQRRHGELGIQPLDWRQLRNLLARLGPLGKGALLLVEGDDGIASGSVHFGHRRVVDFFMSAMDAPHAQAAPNWIGTVESLRWAQERGFRIYNWQSSQSRQSGVYEHKKKWGSMEATYFLMTKVVGPLEPLLALGKSGLLTHYPGHFVLPFGVFGQGAQTRRFRKG